MTLTHETITTERLDELVSDESIAAAHRILWLLLWENELPVLDLLSLDVRNVDVDGRRVTATSQRDEPQRDVAVSEPAARLLGELVGDREAGRLLIDRGRAVTWEQAVQVAAEHGHGIHEFRLGGKSLRQTQEQSGG